MPTRPTLMPSSLLAARPAESSFAFPFALMDICSIAWPLLIVAAGVSWSTAVDIEVVIVSLSEFWVASFSSDEEGISACSCGMAVVELFLTLRYSLTGRLTSPVHASGKSTVKSKTAEKAPVIGSQRLLLMSITFGLYLPKH